MTLHWWMHWFWVTLQLAGLLASPLPSTTQDPRIPETRNPSIKIGDVTIVDPRTTELNETMIYPQSIKQKPKLPTIGTSLRIAKAISSYDDSSSKIGLSNRNDGNDKEESREVEITTRRIYWGNSTGNRSELVKNRNRVGNVAKRDDPNAINPENLQTTQPDSEITWLLTTSKTPERRKKKNESFITKPEVVRNFSAKIRESEIEEEGKDLTVLPLRIETARRVKIVVNSTRTITDENADGFSSIRTVNGSEDIEIEQELAEPRLSATAASIFQDLLTAGISESTRLSRARNAFSSDFQSDGNGHDRSDVSEVILEANESINRQIETSPSSSSSSTPSVIDIAAITGSCLATIVLLSTMASLGFIMYRRKYLNPPQTLNSDKCSNPDSSGYIDDSTIRDNSEEMYSLDNDSFLNSLEAMTIQNYWTDSVKHTKL